jgi:membrane protein YqaA with SNARE-associated domain
MFAGIVAAIREWATAWGGVGLLTIGALDSSFLSFPQVNDILVIYLSIRNPERWVYYAGMSALGSLIGCMALYALGRTGGTVFLRKRFKPGHVERVLRIYDKYGLLAVIVPALLPPPTPFKLFVLMAGAGGVSALRFVLAIIVGRGLRYFGQAWLAVTYGERALTMVRDHSAQVGIGLAAAIVLTAALIYVVKKRRGEADGAAA